jgi:prepilin-type N-terminal cleavage/methylation domain-containing protein
MNSSRAGFTVVEVLVAVVLLAVILTMLGGLTFSTSRQSVANANAATRQSTSLELVNMLTVLPYDMLVPGMACDTVGTIRNRYQRCVTVAAAGAGREVVINTTPLQYRAAPSTVRFMRASPVPTQNPLCTLGGC